MTDMFDDDRLLAGKKELQREIGMRRHLYPQWVAAGKMKQEVADRQLSALEGLLEFLQEKHP